MNVMLSPNPKRIRELEFWLGLQELSVQSPNGSHLFSTAEPPALTEGGHSVPEKEWRKSHFHEEKLRESSSLQRLPPGFMERTLRKKHCLHPDATPRALCCFSRGENKRNKK